MTYYTRIDDMEVDWSEAKYNLKKKSYVSW